MLSQSQPSSDSVTQVLRNWETLGHIVKRVTGRTLVGTEGGLYSFSQTELRIPRYDLEAGIHELCHYVVASEEERKQPNMGLSLDWSHPRFGRMVWCEEAAWSLEFFLFGDPSVSQMASYLTPEARASGGGYYITMGQKEAEEAARAEAARAARLVWKRERLRREALAKAESILPVEIVYLSRSVRDEHHREERRRQEEANERATRIAFLENHIQLRRADLQTCRLELSKLKAELRQLQKQFPTKRCPATFNGLQCDFTGYHTEHGLHDVYGNVMLTWGSKN